MHEPNPLAADQTTNPYAAPMTQSFPPSPQGTDGIWRHGKLLIVHRLAALPTNVCIKSNEPTDGYRMKRKLSWHPPWIAITVLISPLIYILLAMILSKRATIFISLSDAWRSKRSSRIIISWSLMILGIIVMFAGVSMLDPRGNEILSISLLLGGLALMIAAAVYGLIGARMVSATKIEGDYVYVKGAHPDFVDRFPPTGTSA